MFPSTLAQKNGKLRRLEEDFEETRRPLLMKEVKRCEEDEEEEKAEEKEGREKGPKRKKRFSSHDEAF